jgi:ATP-dependent Clp protease ATP-binding subunit ClpA
MIADVLADAHEAAEELGHGWLGAEHLLVALLRSRVAGEALRECGLRREAAFTDLSNLPDSYRWKTPFAGSAVGTRLVTADAAAVLARAEGVAVGLGSEQVRPEHILLSLIWHPTSDVAITVMERHGATQSRLLEALAHHGFEVPNATPPSRPEWGPMFSISRDQFESLTQELRRAGVLYCFNYMGEAVRISVEQKDPGPALVRERVGDVQP